MNAPEPKARVVRISEKQVAKGEQEVGAPEPKAPVAWMCERQVEGEIPLGLWRALVARMW